MKWTRAADFLINRSSPVPTLWRLRRLIIAFGLTWVRLLAWTPGPSGCRPNHQRYKSDAYTDRCSGDADPEPTHHLVIRLRPGRLHDGLADGLTGGFRRERMHRVALEGPRLKFATASLERWWTSFQSVKRPLL
jgi:hypothetical protein